MTSTRSGAPGRPYLEQLHSTLPRLLGAFDLDSESPTAGLGDRERWAWRTVDFADATWQCSTHGLATLASAGLLPAWLDAGHALRIVGLQLDALVSLVRPDGSVEEAFPFERSWCVTALAALSAGRAVAACRDLGAAPPSTGLASALARMRAFVRRGDESHGRISNHRATAAACLLDSPEEVDRRRGRALVEELLEDEGGAGWWPEYGGFDPAYQSLCLHYLSLALDALRGDDPLARDLECAMARGLDALGWCLHGDGSFGGAYGRRGARFLVPTAAEALAGRHEEAASLAARTRRSVDRRRVVTLEAVPDRNVAILFNAYALAAVGAIELADVAIEPAGERRFDSVLVRRQGFDGVVVDLRDGTTCRFDRTAACWTGPPAWSDECGWSVVATKDRPVVAVVEGSIATLQLELRSASRMLPGSWSLFALRGLGRTLFAIPACDRLIKRLLVRFAYAPGRRTMRTVTRTIDLATGEVRDDSLDPPPGRRAVDTGDASIECTASRGYWQRGSDEA